MSDLIPRYREMAATGEQFFGLSVLQHVASIKKLARSVGAKSMLDYGCGRGDAYRSPHKLHRQIGISRLAVRLYDPAFPQHDRPPQGRWDLVVSSDVLEHVPAGDVEAFLRTVFNHARKAVWISVCCRPAKKTFPGTGINLHVTLQPYLRWHEAVSRASVEAGGIPFILVETP